MPALPHSQSIFGFSTDATTWLLVVVLLAITGFIILLAAYHITFRRLDSRRECAMTMLKALPHIVKEPEAAQDPQGQHGITSEELAMSIAQ